MFEELLRGTQFICNRIPLWVQGQGGNVSFKEDDTLFIKTSGSRLDQIANLNDLVSLDLNNLRFALDEAEEMSSILDATTLESFYPQLLKQSTRPGQGKSPSMETGFHAILPKKFVFHFHSVTSLIIAEDFSSRRQWMEKKLNADGLTISVVEFVPPGWSLIGEVKKNLKSDIILLKNHGVIIQSTDSSLLEKWWEIERSFVVENNFSKLAELYTSDLELEKLIQKYKFGKFSYYFPDSAVFAKQIYTRLLPVASMSDIFEYNCQGMADELNIQELWIATQVINELSGRIPEIPSSLCALIQGLPAEKLRLDKKDFQ